MKANKCDLNKCGIYCIQNIENKKVYIGKSINIYSRITTHIYNLNNSSKDENRHLINAWNKYGSDKFVYFVLEYLDPDEELVSSRELYWILFYKSTDRTFGYNLRMDSSTKMIVHDETKKILSKKFTGEQNPNFGNKWSFNKKLKLSNKIKNQFKEGRERMTSEQAKEKIKIRNNRWKNNPELKEKMISKVREKNTKYKIYQYTKDEILIKIWDSINDIILQNPTYKRHNIYAVCSGEKPTMYGYKWKKVKNDEEIVQAN